MFYDYLSNSPMNTTTKELIERSTINAEFKSSLPINFKMRFIGLFISIIRSLPIMNYLLKFCVTIEKSFWSYYKHNYCSVNFALIHPHRRKLIIDINHVEIWLLRIKNRVNVYNTYRKPLIFRHCLLKRSLSLPWLQL